VADGDGGAASATVPVVIRNLAPRGVITANVTTVQTLLPVLFAANASTDADGSIVSWLWDFGDGSTSTERAPVHSFHSSNPTGATYAVRLTVWDNTGANNTVSMDITVQNRPPTAVITHVSPVYATVSAIFRGTSSSDEDGAIVNWTWDFGDGSTAYGEEVGHSYATARNYTIKLTALDNRGGTTTVQESFEVVAKPVFDTGQPGGQPTGPQTQPGFEGAAGLLALLAVAAVIGLARRKR
jgi:PKD repeat protein